MALDGLGPNDIEVDSDMSRPSDPMPCKRTCARGFAPILFSTRKNFWEMAFGVFGVLKSSTDSRHVSTRSKRCESDARDFYHLKNKNSQQNL